MGVKQLKVDVNDLMVGMFVSGLDRPWAQTPFPLQGFYIRELTEIRELQSHCRYVYIDVAKGAGPLRTKLKALEKKASAGGQSSATSQRDIRVKVVVSPLKIARGQYPAPAVSLKKEINGARQLHSAVFQTVGDVLQLVGAGEAVPVKETRRVAGHMVDSVLRNPDAFTWLSKVKDMDEHTYAHSMRAAVWAIIFGRHIGMSKQDLDTLAMGVLLKDVGKVKIPHQIIDKAERSEKEERVYQRFVEFGVNALRKSPNMDPKVISVLKHHCERINGSGFPQQLRGDKISLGGKIAGIVTFYDETINPRGKSSVSPSKAVAKLYAARDKDFQEELVVEFIRAIGLYPTGTLIALNTGQVAVVVEQNFERRLKPKIMVVLDSNKTPLAKPYFVDLAEDDRQKQALVDKGKKTLEQVGKIEIANDLEPGHYDVDVVGIRDQYLFNQNKKGLLSLLRRKSA